MEEFLTSSVFKYLCFPIGSAILGVGVKVATRNDQYPAFKKEDMAVGLDLILSALLMLIVFTTNQAVSLSNANKQLSVAIKQKPFNAAVVSKIQVQAQLLSTELISSGWKIAFMFLCLWSISTIVRKWGWAGDGDMRPFIGIAIPLASGLLALTAVMAGASR